MEILSVDTSVELKRAKNIMLWSVFAYVAIYLLALFFGDSPSILVAVANIGMLVAWVVGCYGLYCFSKLAHSFCFRYYMFSVLVSVAYILMLGIVFGYVFSTLLDTYTTQSLLQIPWISLSVFVVIMSLAALVASIYLMYKISYEMAYLTGLKQFILAFKLYVIAVAGLLLLSMVSSYLLYDFVMTYTEPLFNAGGMSFIQDYFEEFVGGRLGSFIMFLVLFIVMLLVGLASYIFMVLGVWNIKEVKVRPLE